MIFIPDLTTRAEMRSSSDALSILPDLRQQTQSHWSRLVPASWVPAAKAPEIMFEDWNGNRAWDIYRTYMRETGTENTVA